VEPNWVNSGQQPNNQNNQSSSASRSQWRSSIHIYISLLINNPWSNSIFFFSDRAWWSRPDVREGKTTTNTYAAMPLGGRGNE
jgi:hypothetical protein